MTQRLYTVSETAEILGVSPSRIRHMIKDKVIQPVAPTGQRIPDHIIYDLLIRRVRKSKSKKLKQYV